MKLFLLMISCVLLAACTTTTTPGFTKQQEQQSKALGILENYTPSVLAAAALPLQDYCHQQHWPAPQAIDTTQALVANLVGLYYTPVNAGFYQANFGLLDQTSKNAEIITNWRILIPKINPLKTTVQKVKLEIINDEYNIHLLNVMDFQCTEPVKLETNKTRIQSNKTK